MRVPNIRHQFPVVEDLLRNPLSLGAMPVAYAPVRYRAVELGDQRFAWTVPPFLRPVAGASLPSHYALVLRLSPMGDWLVEDAKGFEWAEHAERWAKSLWRDAASRWRGAVSGRDDAEGAEVDRAETA